MGLSTRVVVAAVGMLFVMCPTMLRTTVKDGEASSAGENTCFSCWSPLSDGEASAAVGASETEGHVFSVLPIMVHVVDEVLRQGGDSGCVVDR
jgi:hypothetical protein